MLILLLGKWLLPKLLAPRDKIVTPVGDDYAQSSNFHFLGMGPLSTTILFAGVLTVGYVIVKGSLLSKSAAGIGAVFAATQLVSTWFKPAPNVNQQPNITEVVVETALIKAKAENNTAKAKLKKEENRGKELKIKKSKRNKKGEANKKDKDTFPMFSTPESVMNFFPKSVTDTNEMMHSPGIIKTLFNGATNNPLLAAGFSTLVIGGIYAVGVKFGYFPDPRESEIGRSIGSTMKSVRKQVKNVTDTLQITDGTEIPLQDSIKAIKDKAKGDTVAQIEIYKKKIFDLQLKVKRKELEINQQAERVKFEASYASKAGSTTNVNEDPVQRIQTKYNLQQDEVKLIKDIFSLQYFGGTTTQFEDESHLSYYNSRDAEVIDKLKELSPEQVTEHASKLVGKIESSKAQERTANLLRILKKQDEELEEQAKKEGSADIPIVVKSPQQPDKSLKEGIIGYDPLFGRNPRAQHLGDSKSQNFSSPINIHGTFSSKIKFPSTNLLSKNVPTTREDLVRENPEEKEMS